MQISLAARFDQGYIAHPYWPERERLINIQKESGTKRARSSVRALEALRNHLATLGMTQDDYLELERRADRPFYCRSDSPGNGNGHLAPEEIIIPTHQLYGCLAQAASLASASIRPAPAAQIRTVLRLEDWATGKTAADGLWERFVVVTAGSGARLSNQRALRSNPYIHHFTASGELRFSEEITTAKKVRDFLIFAGREIGVGASRKIGWGRFEITDWIESQ